MKLTTILFDLDGTLLPMDNDAFTKGYFKLLAAKLAPHGYEPKQLVDAVWAGTAAMVKYDGTQSNEEAFWKKFAGIYGEKVFTDLDVSAVLSPNGHTVTLFVVNRSLCDSVQCQFQLTEQAKLVRHISMAGFAPDTVNTADSAPVCPKELPVDSDSGVVLPEASWNMLQFYL